jgi:plasmid stabilization system protein ParE
MDKKKETARNAYKISISTNAIRNLDEITGYIAFINQQPINAIIVGDAIIETIHRIEKHPFSFKECEILPTKSKKYRQAICKSWNIIYKVNKNLIIVLGIVHVSRKPSKLRTLKKAK